MHIASAVFNYKLLSAVENLLRIAVFFPSVASTSRFEQASYSLRFDRIETSSVMVLPYHKLIHEQRIKSHVYRTI